MSNNVENKRVSLRKHSPEFKAKVVLESFQRDTTIESVKRKYAVSSSQVYAWRDYFKHNIVSLFEKMGSGKNKKVSKEMYSPGESPEELKKVIGDLTVQNALLKKAQELFSSQ
jgi:transposase-like protein